MSAPSVKTIRILATFLLLAGGLQLSGSAHAANATQKAADRASHDRWARNEPAAHHSSTDEDDKDDEADSKPHSHAAEPPPGHAGELNGHLSLHGW